MILRIVSLGWAQLGGSSAGLTWGCWCAVIWEIDWTEWTDSSVWWLVLAIIWVFLSTWYWGFKRLNPTAQVFINKDSTCITFADVPFGKSKWHGQTQSLWWRGPHNGIDQGSMTYWRPLIHWTATTENKRYLPKLYVLRQHQSFAVDWTAVVDYLLEFI